MANQLIQFMSLHYTKYLVQDNPNLLDDLLGLSWRLDAAYHNPKKEFNPTDKLLTDPHFLHGVERELPRTLS